jgi:hypothetical protein
MKTTIEIADDLLIRAKKRAAEERSSLRCLVEAGLRRELARGSKRRENPKRWIRWVTVPGKTPQDLDIRNRDAMYEWLRKNP